MNTYFYIPKLRTLFLVLSLGFSLSSLAAEPAKTKIPGQLKKHSIGLGLGQTFLHGDLGDLGDDQVTFTDFFYQYSASHSFALLGNFHFSNHDEGATEASLMGVNASFKANMFQFDSFTPYALGGLGFYWPKVERFINGRLTSSETKTVFGYNLGAGIDLKLNDQFSVGALLQFHNPFDADQNGAPKVEGSYTKFLLTLFYTFI